MKLGLVMIVRDEAAIIGRCLESVRPLISSWTITDTGSTDGTPEIVLEALHGIDGTLRYEPWVGFGENRTRALRAARGTGADYQLVLDADMTVEGEIPALLEADAYLLWIRDSGPKGHRYRHTLLLRDAVPWVYTGATHEGLGADRDQPLWKATLDDLSIVHHLDGSRRPRKLIDDLALLSEQYRQNPEDPRTTFYLAQTFADLGLANQAIELYRQRVEMNGWDEERFYARYQLGCLLAAHRSFDEGADVLLAAWRERPSRVEPLRALANAANSLADKKPIPDDLLFLHTDQYAAV